MLLILTCTFLTISDTAKVIFNGMHSSDSHIASMLPLATRLAKEQHVVHFLETNTKPSHFNYPNNITFTHVELQKDPFFVSCFLKVMWIKIFSSIEFPRIWETGDKAFVEMLDQHPEKINKVMNESWDLVVADELFAVASYALAMKAYNSRKPFVTLSTCIPTNLIKYYFALGTPFSHRPSMYHRLAIPHRIEQFASRLYSVLHETYQAIRTQHVTRNVAVKGLHKVGIYNFDFSKLATHSAYHFLEDIDSLVYPAPVSSAIVEVGFYCRKAKELPNDYDEFINDPTSKGTILVAFGSNIIWDYAPPDIMAAMLGAINRLSDYRVVFSYNGNMEHVRFLDSHVKVTRWAPQKDILAHRKTVVFVSHGGLKSVKDTICGAVPVVYIPLFAEQSHNCEMARAAGFAEVLHKSRLTADVIERAVRKVAETPQYKESVIRINTFYRDRIMPSLDIAEFYVRRALKTSPRLPIFKPKGMYMSLFSHIHCENLLISALILYILSQ
uniref:UDP-glucuronosyltransferase n=1 Tax=Haemonchus contortus TaxID=6289 RepID=A0A7I5EAM9_HAECO